MSKEPNVGIAAAVDALEGQAAGAPSSMSGDEAELELFDNQDAAEGPLTEALQRRARGRGRPPGSPNKRTSDLRRWVLSRYKHPVIAAAEIYSMPATVLAGELGCSDDVAKAVLIQLRAMEFVAPYIEAKMPQRIAISDPNSLPAFHLHFGQQGAELRDDNGATVNLTELAQRAKRAMDQRLIEGEAIKSHDDGSQGEAKDEQSQDDSPF